MKLLDLKIGRNSSMKGHIKSKILLMLLAFILFVSACGKTSEDSTEGKSDSESGSEVADEIVFAPNTDAQNLDPHVLNDNTSMQVSKMIYSALLKYDENNDIVGDVAEDWEVSDDGLEWTFYLRDGVTFHDGAKLDAEAVKKNFERVLDENNALVHRAYFEMITDIEVIDDLTIVFKTDEPFAPFEAHMSVTGAGIISPNAIDEFGNDLGQNVDSIIGSGPYKIVEWNKDEQMVLERFDDYHGDTPPTKRIVYKPILEDSTRLIALETGEVDVIQGIPANELERLESLDNVVVSSEIGNGNRFFRFDTSKAPLDDPLVRQAISYAVDRNAIVDNLFPGAAQVATSAITSSVWGYTDLGPIPQDKIGRAFV